MVKDFPFIEKRVGEEIYERLFTSDLNAEDLKWHWDEEDRIISPLHETDWMFQFDNELPQRIEGAIKIPQGVWHRLIGGKGDLLLKVIKIKK